jgi:4-amino-4-deoxy-L-arabinose transferase-like glycosyltransferase
LLTSFQFAWSARFGTSDVLLTLFLYLAVYGYLRLSEAEGDSRWWLLIGAACGLAFMVKSAASLVGPAAIVLALLLDGRMAATLRSAAFWRGVGLAALIVLPWHIFILATQPALMARDYFGLNFLERAATTVGGHSGDRYFYIAALQQRFFPWFYGAPVAAALAVAGLSRGERQGRLVWLLAALVFVIYTIAQTKLEWYIVPLYPALALLVGATISEALGGSQPIALAGLLLAVGAAALIVPVGLALTFAVLIVIAYGVAHLLRRPWQPALALALLACLLLAAVNHLRPLAQRTVEPLAELASLAADGGREPLIAYGQIVRPTVQYYSNRPVRQVPDEAALVRVMADRPRMELFIAQEAIATLEPRYQVTPLAEKGGYIYGWIAPAGAPAP